MIDLAGVTKITDHYRAQRLAREARIREMFEAWAVRNNWRIDRHPRFPSQYDSERTQYGWGAYQAGVEEGVGL